MAFHLAPRTKAKHRHTILSAPDDMAELYYFSIGNCDATLRQTTCERSKRRLLEAGYSIGCSANEMSERPALIRVARVAS